MLFLKNTKKKVVFDFLVKMCKIFFYYFTTYFQKIVTEQIFNLILIIKMTTENAKP